MVALLFLLQILNLDFLPPGCDSRQHRVWWADFGGGGREVDAGGGPGGVLSMLIQVRDDQDDAEVGVHDNGILGLEVHWDQELSFQCISW